jgi:hypothetical protein
VIEETKEHLFNGCCYSQMVWDQGAQIMRRSNQSRGSIRDTIAGWGTIAFNNPILNHIWILLPGLILWQLWKERNKRIFHSKGSPPELIWHNVVTHIKETIRSRSWRESDRVCPNEELSILQSWQLNLNDLVTAHAPKTHIPSPSNWTPPPTIMSKSTLMAPQRATQDQPKLQGENSGHDSRTPGGNHKQCCGADRLATGPSCGHLLTQPQYYPGRGLSSHPPTDHQDLARGQSANDITKLAAGWSA